MEDAPSQQPRVAVLPTPFHFTFSPPTIELTDQLRKATIAYWRSWLSKCTYKGRWREAVYRSALCLKLLTFQPTGAIVAAATTSLPEHVGGVRNWDYRFTWIRDSSFVLYTFIKLGFRDEARAFMKWLEQRCIDSTKQIGNTPPAPTTATPLVDAQAAKKQSVPPSMMMNGAETNDVSSDASGGDSPPLPPPPLLQIMYGIHGENKLPEYELLHLEGYKQSTPVRIGNGAFNQLQLDIYGELLDTLYLSNKYAEPLSYDMWCYVKSMVNWMCRHWMDADEGIWEVRGGRRHFVYSKMMSWVAIDRGIKLAEARSFPADTAHWYRARNQIFEDIMKNGWNAQRQSFVQFYGADTLDASLLMMPLVDFITPTDPRFVSTLNAILRSVNDEIDGLVSNNLVFRYNVARTSDGLTGDEGTFCMCTFWAVEALGRLGRYEPAYLDQAQTLFEQMLGYANHVGLFAEEIGRRGEHLGNFPQAFTHLALVSAAINLNASLDSL